MTTAHDTRTRLPDIEQWLDDHDIAWTLDDVDLATVDRQAGLANQTRLDALNGDAVARYTADMETGAQFPPVILRRDNAGDQWLPVDGNHRITAARAAGHATHPAYLLERVTAEQAHELAIAANRTHGLPLTDEERLWHAVSMVDKSNASISAAAQTCGIPRARLHAHLAAQQFTKRAAKLGIRDWSALNTSTRSRLAGITDDRVFRRLTELAASGALIHREIDETITRVNTLDVNAALDHIAELKASSNGRTRNTRGKPASPTLSPRKRILTDLDLLIARFTPNAVADDTTTDAARQQVANQITVAVRHLMRIHDAVTGKTTGRR